MGLPQPILGRGDETAANIVQATGTAGRAVLLDWWEAIKDPARLDRAELLNLAPGPTVADERSPP